MMITRDVGIAAEGDEEENYNFNFSVFHHLRQSQQTE